jgi:hypothetical protein
MSIKIGLIGSLFLSIQLAQASKVGQSADETLAQYPAGVQAVELNGKIPDILICGRETLRIKSALEGKSFLGVWQSFDGTSVALIVPEDGEQEHGYFVQTSALLKLKSGRVTKISAHTFSGYWWADGDHGVFTKPAECTL